jgi:hypothetical protein
MAVLLRNTTMEATRERYSSSCVATFFIEAPRFHSDHEHPMPEYRFFAVRGRVERCCGFHKRRTDTDVITLETSVLPCQHPGRQAGHITECGRVRIGPDRSGAMAGRCCGSGRGQAHGSSDRENILPVILRASGSCPPPSLLKAGACVLNEWNPRFKLSPLLRWTRITFLYSFCDGQTWELLVALG